LPKAERLWLAEILKLNFSNFEVKSLKVKLWNKLPEDFDPDKIDNRLIRDKHLTLIGLWYVNPESPIFGHVSKIIKIIVDLIHKNPVISQVTAKEIAALTRIRERDVTIALKLLFELGDFFGAGGGPREYYGFSKASFRQDNSAYEKFLRFKNLEEEMERFFISGAAFNIKKKELIETQFPQFCKKQPALNTWNAIQKEYGVSKKDFGKKINFVSDPFKRKIIFRDVEHAFALASQDFSKPAVILAGSVIEELLRLYLEHNKVSPQSNNFDGYIKTCEQRKLLKSGISRLSDSVRHFRNLVHLSTENSNRSTISKATAKGAVASIFTIANDFQKVLSS
ncbi:MAG: hypothetical protein ACYSRR_03405, partial [Planctomycetota bacterium]|jgi:hypothetical protein